MRVTVIGIGQTMRGDDGAGIEAVRRWEQGYSKTAGRADVTVQYRELPGLDLLDLLDGFDAALIVDAVQRSAAPGSIHRLSLEDLSAFSSAARTAHGWGIAETLQLDRQLNRSRPSQRIRLIGIEAGTMELGEGLSTAVQDALPEACRAIHEELQAFSE